jgi:hypothetical protein
VQGLRPRRPYRPWGPGAGTYYGKFLHVNRSDSVGAVSGFPQVTPTSAEGWPLSAAFTSGQTREIGAPDSPQEIDLEPGAAAFFAMDPGEVANYSRSICLPRQAATLRMAIPGTGGPPLSLRSGLEVCTRRSNVSVGRIE